MANLQVVVVGYCALGRQLGLGTLEQSRMGVSSRLSRSALLERRRVDGHGTAAFEEGGAVVDECEWDGDTRTGGSAIRLTQMQDAMCVSRAGRRKSGMQSQGWQCLPPAEGGDGERG
jgi:hypothetical protein